MKRIDKQQAPEFFTEFVRKNSPQQWNDITPVRTKLRQCLREEQQLCCAYTEVNLPDSGKCHIDHFKTRNLFPELTFDYNNLLVSCNHETYGAKHKDKRIKNKEDYTDLINPVEESSDEYIEYTFLGDVEARNNSAKGKKTIEYFNLNEKYLVERRKTVLIGLSQLKGFTKDEMIVLFGEFESMIRQLYE
jgi:TIGR02646 family protein